ncbi:uncharacterized protein [Salminus brasiliensis]|uniref:uncharacterized protein n=1 Tax=Salminus brasiliensis TaxID=930266 RepID=UPI003B8334D8
MRGVFALRPPAVELRLRPLLFAAGVAAATAGAYYVLSARRSRDRQRTPRTVDAAVQTAAEDPAIHLVITAEDGQLTLSPPFGSVIPYRCPRRFLEQLILDHCPKDVLSSIWTLRFSYRRWYIRDNQKICVRRHHVLLMRGDVTQSWWILTNDFFSLLLPSEEAPIWFASAAQVTFAERIEGHLHRVASGRFTKRSTPKTSGDFQVLHTYQDLVIGDDGWTSFANSWPEDTTCQPEPQQESSASDWPQPGPAPEATGGSAAAREVPALHAFSTIQGIRNFPLKLNALRLAFTFLLSDAERREYVCEAGKAVLGDLADLNDRNLVVFLLAYDRLLALAQDPSCHQGIEEELAQIGIQHFNFIDIVYEVVILGLQAGGRPPICPTAGGFLDHLMAMISSFSATSEQSSAGAQQYQLLVQNALMRFLGAIFALEESVYEDPVSVAAAVWELVGSHVNQLLDSLEALE